MATAAAVTLGGCSLGSDEEPKPATGDTREIAEVVRQLERATAARDSATICNDLFTEDARERAGGKDCERLLRSDAEGVRRPRIELLRIEIEGERATVRVRTRAAGQAEVGDALDLRRAGGEWRVEALAD
jgi:hypothetical protein